MGLQKTVVQPRATRRPAPPAAPGGRHVRPPAPSRWWVHLPWSAPRIVLAYSVVAILWVAFSDLALSLLVRDPARRDELQTMKGVAFVVLTSILLYELVRRGESGIRSRTAELRATVDSMVDGVLVVDAGLNIVEANRAIVELLGVGSKGELLGPLQAWGRRFDLRDADARTIPFERYAARRAIAGERVPAYDARLRRADGQEIFASVSAAPVEGTGLAVVVLRDVSAARRLDQVRDEFLETAAHELKTPLAVIKAYAQLVQKRDPAESQPLVAIQRQVDRLDRLVHHLLDTSRLRLEADGRRERLDLGALATDVVEQIRRGAPRHTFTVDAPAPAPVDADAPRLARVVAGLVDNAVRFSPYGGPVAVRVEARAGEAVLSVTDLGVGIPQERQGRVFERYYHAHADEPDDSAGLGLGLEVSRAIVERHGGRMAFESAPGRGSTFFLVLPLAAEARA